ncbi:hypothetical protein ACFQ08_16820 [Streptosporangium algeriense]|uniref:Uncharacterized protein n=1 Tax=Streptosporangium algeriense TaxID=1682748 RepID=A0ABW3DQW2_9ACTN
MREVLPHRPVFPWEGTRVIRGTLPAGRTPSHPPLPAAPAWERPRLPGPLAARPSRASRTISGEQL